MYQRYYDGYNIPASESIPAQYEVKEVCDGEAEPAVTALLGRKCRERGSGFSLETDDLLLIGVLIFLLHEECNDKPMILIIGFLLLSGFIS